MRYPQNIDGPTAIIFNNENPAFIFHVSSPVSLFGHGRPVHNGTAQSR